MINKIEADKIDTFKNKVVKIQTVMTRATPIMETLTGLMIGGLIYYSGNLIVKGELELDNFFSFLFTIIKNTINWNEGPKIGLLNGEYYEVFNTPKSYFLYFIFLWHNKN